MKLIDSNFNTGIDSKTWQSFSIAKTMRKLDAEISICLVNNSNNFIIQSSPNLTDEIVERINRSDVGLVLYMMCDHGFETSTSDYNLLKKITKPVIIITHSKLNIDIPNIEYLMWLTLAVQTDHLENINDYRTTTNPKKYLYSCLMNKSRVDRSVNICEFVQSEYYERSLVTFNTINLTKYELRAMREHWSKYYDMLLRKIAPMCPINTSGGNILPLDTSTDSWEPVFSYNNDAYLNSYLHVIAESHYDTIFVSEKTTKCMLATQFFVIIAGAGTIQKLRDLGFDTYDDIIDHNRYDNADDSIRIQRVHELLKEMQDYDWHGIYQATEARREYNRQKLLNLDIEQKFLQQLHALIN